MLAQAHGLRIGAGGVRNLIDAMVALLRRQGGELVCASAVTRVLVDDGAAVGVQTNSEKIAAKRAVIANLAPTVLFKLLEKPLTTRRFRFGPGTMMIHLALSDLPAWRDSRARQFLYVHIAPSLEAMSRAYREAISGVLPEAPVLIVAQPTVADPSRAPAGKHVLSIQVRVLPPVLEKETYADRIIDLLGRYAPGLRQKILARHVISPADLEHANPNLVGGDSLGGSHHLDQQFLLRPFLGWSRYHTPVERLYMCGASTWPGAGSGAASGWILGNMLSERRRA
jgi:phytoene dehydrogenase-like protein